MIDLRTLSDDRIEREIAGLLEKAAHCSPGCSLIESIRHTDLIRRLAALRDEEHRRHLAKHGCSPLADLSHSRGRRRRRGGVL